MYKNSGKPWTSEEEAQLVRHVEMYGQDVAKIAEAHGRSVVAINMRIESIIRQLVRKQNQPIPIVGRIFSKSSDEIEEILKPPSHRRNSRVNDQAQKLEELNQKMDRVLVILKKLLKRVPPSSSDNKKRRDTTTTTTKKKKKKKRKKRDAYSDDEISHLTNYS
jgi:transposase-like protein